MKSINLRMLKAVVVAASLAAFSGPAQAILVGGTEVGSIDTLLDAYLSDNSGDAAEIAAIEAACNCDVTFQDKVDNPTTLGPTGGIRAIDVSPDSPGFFVLKFGVGNPNTVPAPNDTFVFENVNLLTFLVWSDAVLVANGLPSDHVQSISHYLITGNTSTPSVPEPSSLILLGTGLVVFATTARRFRRSR